MTMTMMMMSTRRLSIAHAVRMAGAGRPLAGRSFSFSTSSRLGLKETSSQTDPDYDRHKKDSLAKQRRGSGHWKPELASDSEEAVRADRAARGAAAGGEEESTATLQERTKRAAEETSRAGTSMRDGM